MKRALALLALWILSGATFSWFAREPARASSTTAVQYRVLETTKIGTLEKEMNAEAQRGCRIVQFEAVPGSAMAVMECTTP